MDLTAQEIRRALQRYGFTAQPELCQKIQSYVDLLLLWNQRIGLTTVTQPQEIVARHFGESVLAAQVFGVERGRLADLGSGAGFPGLVLRMACPGLEVVLIEANRRKCVFLAEVCRRLQLSRVDIRTSRFEELAPAALGVDYITVRALRITETLLEWASHALKPSGKLILWLGLEDANRVQQMRGWEWSTPVRIPWAKRRVILRGALRST